MNTLSQETIGRMEYLRSIQNTYQPNLPTSRLIGGRALVMFVAPTGVGKTYIMNEIARAHHDFKRVSVFTTRPPRPDDDPGMFSYVPHTDRGITELHTAIDSLSNTIVQFAVHPNKEAELSYIYGTATADYPGKYNMLATLSHAVDGLRELPFKSTDVVGLVTDSETWKSRFEERFGTDHPQRASRLAEARSSLTWLLEQPIDTITWINNIQGAPETTADRVVGILKNDVKDLDEQREIRTLARDMLAATDTIA